MSSSSSSSIRYCKIHESSSVDSGCSACRLDVARKRLALQQEKLELDKQLLRAEKRKLQSEGGWRTQLQREHEAATKTWEATKARQEEELNKCHARINQLEATLAANTEAAAKAEVAAAAAEEEALLPLQKQAVVKELQEKLRESQMVESNDLKTQLRRERQDDESFVGELEVKLSEQEKEVQKYQAPSSSKNNFAIQQYQNRLQSLRLAMEVAVRRTEMEWKTKTDELEVAIATQEGEFEERLATTTASLEAELTEVRGQLETREKLHAEERMQLEETIKQLQNGQQVVGSSAVARVEMIADQSEELKMMQAQLTILQQKQQDCLQSREEILNGLREVIAEVKECDVFEEHIPSLEAKITSLQDQLNALELREAGDIKPAEKPATRRRSKKLVHVTDLEWVGTNQKGTYTGHVDEMGEPHGRGILRVENGDVYEGEWKNGKRHGQGVYTWQHGDLYTGPWRNNKRHGHGVFVWSDGRLFDGEYNMGKREGKGIFTWPYGAKYEGDFHENKRNGFGVYIYSDGRTYTGEYMEDRAHGRGVETDAQGNVLHEGLWSCGEFVGDCSRTASF